MNVAIIAAAGQGTRMAGKRPKQFLELAGTPILLHTLKAFEQCDVIQEIIVVIPPQDSAGFLPSPISSGFENSPGSYREAQRGPSLYSTVSRPCGKLRRRSLQYTMAC